MLKKFKIVILLFNLLMVTGCYYTKEPIYGKEDVFQLFSETEFNCGAGESNILLKFDANEEWEITSNVDWIRSSSLKGGSGKSLHAYLRVHANPTFEKREATVKITCGLDHTEIRISQEQSDCIQVESSRIDVPVEGSQSSLHVNSNIEYSYRVISGKSWIHLENKKISKSPSEAEIPYKIDENLETGSRRGLILLSSEDIETEIFIFQSGQIPEFILTEDTFEIGEEGEIIRVDLKTNSKFSLAIKEDWIKEVQTKTLLPYTRFFEVLPNDTYERRKGCIYFFNEEDQKEYDVTIYQNQKNCISFSHEKFEVPEEGGEYEVEIKTNFDYTYSIDEEDSWLHLVEGTTTKSIENSIIRFKVDRNPEITARKGAIKIKSPHQDFEIKVFQQGEAPQMILSDTTFLVKGSGEVITVELSTNANFEYTILDDWIEEIQTKTIKDYSIDFKVTPNTTYDKRSGTIRFTNKFDEQTYDITIVQRAKGYLEIEKNSYQFDHNEHQINIPIQSSTEIDCLCDADWIKITKTTTKGINQLDYTLEIAENLSLNARNAEIKLSNPEISNVIHIEQNGWMDQIGLNIYHSGLIFDSPQWMGYNIDGYISWGDGSECKFTPSMIHSYQKVSEKPVSFKINGATSFTIESLNEITHFDIYINDEETESLLK